MIFGVDPLSQDVTVKVLEKSKSNVEEAVKSMVEMHRREVPGVPRVVGYRRDFDDGRDMVLLDCAARYDDGGR